MTANQNPGSIRIGLVTDEPIWLEGLASIFDQGGEEDHAQLIPVTGTIEALLDIPTLKYLVVDLNAASNSLKTLDAIRRVRPDIRQIVIGPLGDEELILESIIAGARAYLDSTASPETVHQAIQIVLSGSIWAPRRLLSRLIDRLLCVADFPAADSAPHLTDRERQVLDLILAAHSNREIGRQLGIEERTVKAHVGRLMRKTGADNRIELSIRALNHSLLSHSGANADAQNDDR
jgi:DNA-binding NarL/FixJ family response regulator